MKFTRVLTGLVFVLSVVACSDEDSSGGSAGGSGSGGGTGGAAVSVQEFMATSTLECGGIQSRDQALVARTDYKLPNGSPVIRWVTLQLFPNGAYAYHVLERHVQGRQVYDLKEGQWRASGDAVNLSRIGALKLVRKPGFAGAMLKPATGPALGMIWTEGVNLVSRQDEINECSPASNPLLTRTGDEYQILGRPAAEFYQRELIEPARLAEWRWVSGYRLDSSGRKIWAGVRLSEDGMFRFRLDATKLVAGHWQIKDGVLILTGLGVIVPGEGGNRAQLPILVLTEGVSDLPAPVRFELDHSTN